MRDNYLYNTNEGGITVELTRNEIIKKMVLDSQEMVRDYEVYSKEIDDMEVADLFKTFAEECGFQAAELLKKLNDKA